MKCMICKNDFIDNVLGTPDVCNSCLPDGLTEPLGVKADHGKAPMRLLGTFQDALGDVARVIDHGAKKYSLDNWQRVDPDRYRDALLRHVLAYCAGQRDDEESKLPHLAHVVVNALFLQWFDR